MPVHLAISAMMKLKQKMLWCTPVRRHQCFPILKDCSILMILTLHCQMLTSLHRLNRIHHSLHVSNFMYKKQRYSSRSKHMLSMHGCKNGCVATKTKNYRSLCGTYGFRYSGASCSTNAFCSAAWCAASIIAFSGGTSGTCSYAIACIPKAVASSCW